MQNKGSFYSGIVWVAAAVGLSIYATVALTVEDLSGVEQLVAWLESLSGWWILLAAFIAMFLEGLYFIGSFFPGSTILVLLAVLAGTINWGLFVALIITMYIAWVLAGIVNIFLATRFNPQIDETVVVEDRMLETWFPAFRANHEVAQVVSGADRWQVFFSSLRVKVFGGLVFVFHGAIVPLFFDVTDASNDQGFTSLYIIAAIMLGVGVYQVWHSFQPTGENKTPA